MKTFKMIRGFLLIWSRSCKIMQNVIFHVKLYSVTLKQLKQKSVLLSVTVHDMTPFPFSNCTNGLIFASFFCGAV